MKASIALAAVVALAAKASAACWAQRLGYQCCKNTNAQVVYQDEDGDWGVENNEWCGIEKCWSLPDYQCCKNTRDVVYQDEDGDWGVENNEWCGIISTRWPRWSR